MKNTIRLLAVTFVLLFVASALWATDKKQETGFVALFPEDGIPKGWLVRRWNDVKLPAPAGVNWMVKDGILHGSEPRGTWLVSKKQYSNFILKFEFKLGTHGPWMRTTRCRPTSQLTRGP